MAESLLSCQDVTISYRTSANRQWKLAIPNFVLRRSDFCLLSGDNMSGKSTFLRFIAGAAQDLVLDGVVRRCDQPISHSKQLNDLSIVLSSEDDMFPELSILENVVLGVDPDDLDLDAVSKVEMILREAGIFGQRALRSPVAELSMGGRAVVKFCRAAVSRRPLILMDEVSSFLDEARAHVVLTAAIGFAEAGRAVVMVSHSVRDREFVAARYPAHSFHISRNLDRSILADVGAPRG